MDREEQAFRLWRLLDDIDTLDDSCRNNDAAFRDLVRRVQQRRFSLMTGEDFDSLWEKYEGS
jgi:hypothetical protein